MTDDEMDEMIDRADREAREGGARIAARRGRNDELEYAPHRHSPHIIAGATAIDRFHEDEVLISWADQLHGVIPNRNRDRMLREQGLLGRPPVEVTKIVMAMRDERRRMSEAEIVSDLVRFGSARVHIGTATFDVQNAIVDASDRAVIFGFNEAPEIALRIARVLSTQDFKTAHFPIVSAVPTPGAVLENGEIPETSTISIAKESTKLGTYAATMTVSRQMVINADFKALGALAAANGQAASRLIGDKVMGVITAGTSTALASDGVNLFDAATHTNYVTAGASPSVTTIDAAFTAMALQKSNGVALGITPKFLITPAALHTTAKIITRSINSPNFDQPTDVIPLVDRRLDIWNPQGWFMAADPTLWPAIGVVFLDGNPDPIVEQVKLPGAVDGFGIRVRLDVAALALDYKGLYYNDGA